MPLARAAGVDALDPQPTEVALALRDGRGRRSRASGHLLLGLAVEPRALAAVAAGPLEDDPALLLGVDCPLHACHVSTPCFRALRHRPAWFVGRGIGYMPSSFLTSWCRPRTPDQVARPGGGPAATACARELVHVAGLLAHDLAGAGDLKRFLAPLWVLSSAWLPVSFMSSGRAWVGRAGADGQAAGLRAAVLRVRGAWARLRPWTVPARPVPPWPGSGLAAAGRRVGRAAGAGRCRLGTTASTASTGVLGRPTSVATLGPRRRPLRRSPPRSGRPGRRRGAPAVRVRGLGGRLAAVGRARRGVGAARPWPRPSSCAGPAP